MPSISQKVVHYQLTEREIVGQWFRLRLLQPGKIFLYASFFALGVAIVAKDHRQVIGWAFVAFPFLFALLFYRSLCRVVKQNPAMTGPRSMSFDVDGVVFMSGANRNEYEWHDVQRFAESAEYYFLYLKGLGAVANVPKAAFTPEQREAFLSYARAISGKAS